MNIRRIILMLMLACYSSLQAMDEHINNAVIGGVAGTAEIAINQPLIYFKNTLQRGDAIDWRHPKVWYRGFGMNIAAMGPTTAFQTATNAALEKVMPGTEASVTLSRAFIAGVASATLCAPIDLIILEQQKKNLNALKTISYLYKEAGLRVFARGWSATALREGPWSVAYLVGFPIIQELIRKRIDNPVAGHVSAYVGAGMITGSAVAVITQPIDTIKTRMQTDYQGVAIKNMRDAIHSIYKDGGVKGFFTGTTPRAINCGLAVPFIGTLTMYLTKKVNEHTRKDFQ